jgi:hypothetical protein
MFVLESEGDDPRGPWRFRGQLDSDYGIDMTIHRTRAGKLVAIWAGHCVPGDPPAFGCQALYLSEMANPWTLKGAPLRIAVPTLPWEVVGQPINEGPIVIERGRKLHVVISASFFATDDYKLGRLTVPADADLLDPATWAGAKHPEPIFERDDEAGVLGPGHNMFFKSPDGREDRIAYHATDRAGQNTASFGGVRTVRMQPFGWTASDDPDLGRPVPVTRDLPAPSGDPSVVRQPEDAVPGLEEQSAVGRAAVRVAGRLEVPVEVPRAGTHLVALRLRGGAVRARLAGAAAALAAPGERWAERALGRVALPAGRSTLVLEGEGALDQVRLELEPPGALGLPPARGCRSRRTLAVTVRAPRGTRLRSAEVTVAGRTRVVRVRGLRVPVVLRGLPRGRFAVRIVATTARGERLVAERTYRTCRAR